MHIGILPNQHASQCADYCFGDVKFGGNAQAITKDRQADGDGSCCQLSTAWHIGRNWVHGDVLQVAVGQMHRWHGMGAQHRPVCPTLPACRWLHHTSLLWDFQQPRMALLKQPDRQPEYRQVGSSVCSLCQSTAQAPPFRLMHLGILPAAAHSSLHRPTVPVVQGRDHLEFVVRLKDRLPCRATLADQLCGSLEAAGFQLQVCGAHPHAHALCPRSGPAPGVCVMLDAAAVVRRSHQCCRHPSQCVCLKFALQEASLAEAEEALAASKLCGTRQLDWPQVLAEERQRFEQEQQHEQQRWQTATVGAPQS